MLFFFFKQKTAYEVRISDWSSDVCSSDRERRRRLGAARAGLAGARCGAAVLLQPGGAQPTDAVAVDQLLPGFQLLERQVPPLARFFGGEEPAAHGRYHLRLAAHDPPGRVGWGQVVEADRRAVGAGDLLRDRTSVVWGTRASVRVDPGGRRLF